MITMTASLDCLFEIIIIIIIINDYLPRKGIRTIYKHDICVLFFLLNKGFLLISSCVGNSFYTLTLIQVDLSQQISHLVIVLQP